MNRTAGGTAGLSGIFNPLCHRRELADTRGSVIAAVSAMAKQVHCIVRGRVQGVFFRASAQREARRLCLTGWVKNLPDGSVEAVVEGEDEQVREFIQWAQRGPSAARVDRVETRWRSYTGDFSDFRIES